MSSDREGLSLRLALFTVVVAGLDVLGLALMRLGPHVTTLWPAKGVLLAAILFSSRKNGLFVALLAALASVCAKILLGEALLLSFTTTLISVGGSVATAFAFKWCAGALPASPWIPASAGTPAYAGAGSNFRDWRVLGLFFALACGASALLGIAGATALSTLRGAPWMPAFTGWSLATALSYLIFVPPLVLLAPVDGVNAFAGRGRAILFSAAAMAATTFVVYSDSNFPVFYMLAIALVIVSVAAGIEAAAVGLLVTAMIAVPMTLLKHWPGTFFHGSTELRLIATQIFLVAMTIGILPAAAAVSERNRLRRTLETALAREQETMAQMRESEERYRSLAEHSKDVLVRADKNGIIRYISEGVSALGYTTEELIGTTGASLVHPDDLAAFTANTRALLSGTTLPAPPIREHRFRTKSGAYVWLQGNPTVVCDAAGVPAGLVNVFRDIDDRKAMDAALADATREAEAAAVAKAEFLANMSHELRTPLTSIIGFSQLLQERKDLPEPAMRHVGRVVQAGQALLALVNDILDFSKLEAGQIEIRPEPCAPKRVAADALELFTPQAKQKAIALSLKAGSLPETLLLDEGRVRQVLLNLVGNAVKFTAEGSVTLALDYANGTLTCRVTDTGPGIPKDQLSSLFQRFSQIGGSSGRGGTGLGLAICKGLIEAMGGKIFVESTEGKGSTFGFAIPAGKSAQDAPVAAPAGDALAGLKVLAADDNLANRQLLEAMLKPMGVALTLAENGTSAVRFAREQAFDVVLMDVHMPDMNGADAAAKIRADSLNRATPIFAFTADMGLDPKTERNTVFDGVVLKPLTLAALKKALRETAKAA